MRRPLNKAVMKKPGLRKQQRKPAARPSEQRALSNDLALLEEDQLLAELENLRMAQMEIEQSQQIYAELFDLAPVAFVNLTASGRIENANLAAAALLGTPR